MIRYFVNSLSPQYTGANPTASIALSSRSYERFGEVSDILTDYDLVLVPR